MRHLASGIACRLLPAACLLAGAVPLLLGASADPGGSGGSPPQPPAGSLGGNDVLIAANTVCPIDGEKIDPTLPPIPAHTRSGKLVGIGVCSQRCADLVRKDPQLYVEDALANHRHRQHLTP